MSTVFYVVAFVWLSSLFVVWLLCWEAKRADERESAVPARAPMPDPLAASRRR